MTEFLARLEGYLTNTSLVSGVRAAVLLAAGFVIGRLVARTLGRVAGRRLEAQQQMVLRRFVYYGVVVVFAIAALNQLGFDLGVLLGAAGILSVAVGFASQTSASNIISGLFLLVEQPFRVGDIVEINGTTGEVLAVDLLSTKIRTFDNRYVRIPNESVIKSQTVTLTRFPIRRLDVQIGVAYKEDLERVKRVLFEVAARNPLCLAEPEPLFIFQGFGDSALQLQFSPWATQENFLSLKNSLQLEIKAAFDAEGIEIPFPHRTLYAGSVTEPMPVRVVGQAPSVASVRPEAEPDGSADPDA